MTKTLYTMLAGMALMFTACSTNEIDTWEDGTCYAWFPNNRVDFTFKSVKGIGEGGTALAAIPFTVAANVSDKDREIGIEVCGEPLDSRTKYEVQRPVMLHAGNTSDTVWVKLTNAEHLNTMTDTLKLKIVPSKDFMPGLQDNLIVELSVSNGFPKPAWWDDNCEWVLGSFNQSKMQVVVDCFGSEEDPRGGDTSWWGLAATYVTQVLNDYVQEHRITYPDTDAEHPGMPVYFMRDMYWDWEMFPFPPFE